MGEQMEYPVRYTVQAVDKYQDSSVRSDFVSAIGLLNCGVLCAAGEDNVSHNNQQLPKEYSLNQNYPNPFNPSTKINYDLPFDGRVSIKIFDMTGREVASLVNEFKTAGYYTADFNASALSSGVYFYTISADNFTATKKMILVK